MVLNSMWELLPSEVIKLCFFSEITRREDSIADGKYKQANKFFLWLLSFGIQFYLVMVAIPAPYCLDTL